jgi:hypothetical protein
MGSYRSQEATSAGGMQRVVVFSSPTCVRCNRARTYLPPLIAVASLSGR